MEDPFLGERLEYLPHLGDLSDCRKLYVDVPPDQRPPGIGPRADEIAYRRALARLNRPIGRPKR